MRQKKKKRNAIESKDLPWMFLPEYRHTHTHTHTPKLRCCYDDREREREKCFSLDMLWYVFVCLFFFPLVFVKSFRLEKRGGITDAKNLEFIFNNNNKKEDRKNTFDDDDDETNEKSLWTTPWCVRLSWFAHTWPALGAQARNQKRPWIQFTVAGDISTSPTTKHKSMYMCDEESFLFHNHNYYWPGHLCLKKKDKRNSELSSL